MILAIVYFRRARVSRGWKVGHMVAIITWVNGIRFFMVNGPMGVWQFGSTWETRWMYFWCNTTNFFNYITTVFVGGQWVLIIYPRALKGKQALAFWTLVSLICVSICAPLMYWNIIYNFVEQGRNQFFQ